MQKIISIILTISIIVLFNNLFAQNFEKNNWYIDISIGVGNYSGKTETHTVMPNSLSIDGTPEYISSLIFPLKIEYAISNKIGLGLEVNLTNFSISDENKELVSSMKRFDYGFFVNYHFFSIEKFDLFAGFSTGFSNIKWSFNNPNSLFLDSRKGNGRYTFYSINNRFHFSEKISLLFQLSIANHTYSKITESHYETLPPVSSSYFSIRVTDFRTFGTIYGLGISIKL